MNVMEGELADAVNAIIKEGWDLRDGQVVPETDDITLGNSGVKLDATVLYADLADSTELAIFDREIAAEVYKAYLVGTSRLIKAGGGEIRSFDGDRVMGVFIGNFKNTSAAKTALRINYFFTQVLQPAFQEFYKSLQTGIVKLGSELKHWFHEKRAVSLLRSSLPSRNHQLCRVGLSSILPELPRCRGSSGRTRNHRLL